MLHVIVVGERSDESNEAIAAAIRARPLAGVVMRRCPSPDKLGELVGEIRQENGNVAIDLLDIVDHARPGAQELGSGVLFESSADPCVPLVGASFAAALDPHLAETAHVRLLGCNTAGAVGRHGAMGRHLLFKLSKALQRHRLAFGTLRPTHSLDFTSGRFLVRLEDEILLSAHAVIDADAPIDSDRLANLGTFQC